MITACLIALLCLNQASGVDATVAPPMLNGETYYFLFKKIGARRSTFTPEQKERWKFINQEFVRIEKTAQSLVAQNKFDQAVEIYQGMLRYEPAYAYTYVQMGDVRKAQGDISAALQLYKQGEAIMEDVPFSISLTVEPLTRTGDVYAKLGDFDKAADSYRKIVYRLQEYDWLGSDGKSIKTKLFPDTDRFAYVFAGKAPHRGGNVTNRPDTLARCALYLSRAGQHDEAKYVYGLALRQIRSQNDNPPVFPSEQTIIDDTNVAWADALHLPERTDTRTFEAACYTVMSLTIGLSSWIDESGKLWKADRLATLAAIQKAVALAPDFAPGQFALGLAYTKNQVTEPDATVNAQKAFEKAAKSGNGSVSFAAKEALKQAKVP